MKSNAEIIKSAENKIIVVAGGTGNVGSYLVAGLLKNGATVVVPSRSEQKINELQDYLLKRFNKSALKNVHTYVGNLSDKNEAADLITKIIQNTGDPDGVVSTLGNFVPAPSLLEIGEAELDKVLRGYLFAHQMVAKTFLPGLRDKAANFVFINGPLALKPWKGSGAGLVSIATAAQKMLFESLAQELEDDKVNISEVITYAFIRNKQTQPGSSLTGEDLGEFVARLASGAMGNIHGRSFQLRSSEEAKSLMGADLAS
ncbi:MAG: SDR family oxidoreductase, partial [Balneolales bacterium]